MKIEHLIRQARQHYSSTKKMQLCQLELAKKNLRIFVVLLTRYVNHAIN